MVLYQNHRVLFLSLLRALSSHHHLAPASVVLPSTTPLPLQRASHLGRHFSLAATILASPSWLDSFTRRRLMPAMVQPFLCPCPSLLCLSL
jgi:hypothetical protein